MAISGTCYCKKTITAKRPPLQMCGECTEKLNRMWLEFEKKLVDLGDTRLIRIFDDGVVRHLLPPGSMVKFNPMSLDEPRTLKVEFKNFKDGNWEYVENKKLEWEPLLKEVFGEDVELAT